MAIRKFKRRNALIFLFIIAIMLSSYSSYSKYTSSKVAYSNSKVAVWSIKVNTEDISNKSVLTNNVQFNIMSNSAYIASGKFAPTSEGYFDIVLDTSETEVTVNYNIDIKLDTITSLIGCTIAGYEEILDTSNVSTNIPANLNTVENNQISGTILLEENTSEQVKKLRFYLKWDDDSEIENIEDSNVTIPIVITFEQQN